MSQKIQLLPEHIIDQIKAGEVIERPASAIKELLENSVDAKSTQIDVHLKNNGLELISIIDNGIGMSFEELPFAFLRHATSKISSFDDIYHLHTYGFRGEALASIASIGKIKCTSTYDGQSSMLEIEGGKIINHEKYKKLLPVGTNLHIQELFYNTPARLKFIQSTQSEKARLQKMFKAFLVTYPHLTFSMKWDNEDKQIYQATDDFKQRIRQAFELKDHIEVLNFEQEYENYSIQFFATKECSRGVNNKNQMIFVNQRYITDKKIHHIILNGMQKIWPAPLQGHYCIFINIPSDEIDVNVSPNKTLIKFFLPAKVFSLISATLKNGLQNFNLTANINPISQPSFEISENTFADLTKSDAIEFEDRITEKWEETNLNLEFNSSENTEEFTKLTNGFYLYQNNLKIYLLNLEKMTKSYLNHQFQKPIESMPLLISEPLQYKLNKNQINNLEKLGFEVDQLDPQTMVVRTIPVFLNGLSYVNFIHAAIKVGNEKSISKIIDEMKIEQFSFYLIKSILKQSSITNLLETKDVIEVNESTLQKLF